jgi:molybdopterin biosynthesis enzyme
VNAAAAFTLLRLSPWKSRGNASWVPSNPLLALKRSRDALGRKYFPRANRESEAAAVLLVRTMGHRGSSIFRSMNAASCFTIPPAYRKTFEPVTLVVEQPFYGVP